MNKSNRPVVVYGNDFSLNISVKRYDAQTDDYIDLDLSQVTDLEVYLTCSNNNTTIPLDFTTSGSIIKCEIQYRFLAPQTSYGIVVEAFDEENKHFRFEALPREGFLVVSNTSGFKPAENVDVIDIKARIGWGTVIDAYTKEEMDTKLEDYYDKEAVDDIVDPISERLSDAEGTLNDHTTQIDDLDNNIAINTADIATNKANITKNTNDIRALDEDVDSKQDILVSGENIKTINNESIVGSGNIVVGEADYSKEYFTIESLADDNTITFTPYNDNVLSYSVNKGEWVEGNTVTANKGDNVRWKGELIPDTNENFSSGTFTSTKNINVKGNIMSLKHGDDFEGELTISDLNLFAKLFYKCRTLIDAHNLILPATRLSEESYSSMFTGCTALTKAPELPALTTAYGCYSHMFESCTALTKAPELPATTLAKDCYNSMFIDCTALTIAPKLPALVVADQCYMAMFKCCTALVEAPELPANTLATNCYLAMFEGCTKLVKAPDLPATTLQMQSYHKMFKGCSRLQSVKMMATSINAVQCLLNWMDNVSSTGTMLTDENITLPEGASGLPRGWKQITYIEKGALDEKQDVLVSGTNIKTINNESILGEGNITIEGGGGSSEPVDYSKEYFTIESLADNNTITFIPYTIVNVLSYSTDKGTTWTEGNSVTVNKGDKVLWKGSNLTCGTGVDWSGGPGNFRSSGNIHLSGNIMSLEFGDGFASQTTLTKAHQFSNLFQNSKVVYAHNLILPATQLSQFCYAYMFAFSRSLVKAPRLQALSLAVQCYRSMFESCTSLQDAPELPATTLAAKCYPYMFTSCTALTNPPELPAVVLTDSCYTGMFALCSKLTVGPLLPAQVLAPTCYSQLFEDCTSIKYINMLATDISATNCLNSWVNRVGSSGTMITSGKVTLPEGGDGLPTGWTELQYADPAALAAKQDVLVSGTNIKTINNESILGEGNITIEGGGSSEPVDYSKEYFTIESLADDNTITFTPYSTNTLSYSTDDGTTWTEGNEVTVNSGDKVLWKGSNLSIGMFDGCGKFNSTGNINVSGNIMSLEFGNEFVGKTTLTKTYQFQYLFNGCKKLIDAKDLILPATSLTLSCYVRMFYGCTSLTKAPDLPATTLANYCYSTMFSGCTSLTKAPDLPATTLANECYSNMFYKCTSLVEAPELPATTLVNKCYINMFNGCTNLIYVKMLATSGVSELSRWMENVNSVGIMITSGQLELPKNSADGIPTGWTELPYVGNASLTSNLKTINNQSIVGSGNITIESGGSSEPVDYSKEYFTIESLVDENTITFTPKNNNVLSYSIDDGTTWTEGNEVNVNNGDKVLWKGSDLSCDYGPGKFSSTGNIKVSGNIMSLEFGDEFVGQTTITKNYQFKELFIGCTSLIDAKDLILPATTLSGSCYTGMFTSCSLTIAPELPATTLATGCYNLMFYNCLSLVEAPELPATTLVDSCYRSMFESCTSLIKAPELPATTLANSCYGGMFYGCESLLEAPELPATTLATGCYYDMFKSCISLTKAPELPATRLTSYCCANMFSGCSKLSYVTMLATQILSSTSLENWMSNVASSGIMITSGKVTLIKNSANGIPTGWTELQYADPSALANKQDTLVSGTNIKTINNESILGEGNITIEGGGGSSEPADYSKEYFTIESLADDNTITFTPYSTNTLSYSTDDGTTWTSGNSVTVNKGDKVLWKGSNLAASISNGCGQFGTTSTIKVYGNIMSLIFGDEFVGKTAITKQYQFSNLFNTDKYVGCPIIDASNLILPATILSTRCYYMMFKYCTLLKNAPKLPAKTLTQSCYESMFQNCTSLVEAPEVLPASTLAVRCYAHIFDTCTSLTKAPALPATTLANECYNSMFYECTSLVEAPELPATTLVTECYISMFYRCVNLHFIKMLATDISATNCLASWAAFVENNGTMITSGKVTLPKDSNSGIPTGWTELQYASDQCVQSTTAGLKIEVVNALPASPVANTIYLVRSVQFNLTTLSESELTPGLQTVTYRDNDDNPITSAPAGQKVRVYPDEIMNDNRPDYATEGVDGYWESPKVVGDVEIMQDGEQGTGWFYMPGQDVNCHIEFTWTENPEIEG